MFLCKIIEDIYCGMCPFERNACRNFLTKEEIVQEIEDIRDNAISWLNKIKEEQNNV